MPHITTPDGIEIHYTDYGSGRPVLLSHGWPLSSQAWQRELKLLADAGYRAIAHDRRGHGRSTGSHTGHELDGYAADLAALVEALQLHDLALVGHSAAGGGEVLRYTAQHGGGRVTRLVLIGAEPRDMVQSETNPAGVPREVFDGMRAGVLDDRAEFWRGLAEAFFGTGGAGPEASAGVKDDFWRQAMQTELAAAYEEIAAFSETEQTDELAALTIPVLIAHGDADQIIPVEAAHAALEHTQNGTLKIYAGAPHGIHGAYQRELFADLLDFLRA